MFLIYPFYIIFIKLIFCFSPEQRILSNYNKKKIFNNINILQPNRLRFLDNNNKKNQTAADWLEKRVENLIKKEIKDFLLHRANMSQTCKDLFYKCIIHKDKPKKEDEDKEDEEDVDNIEYDNVSVYYFRKIFRGASKHKNDLSTYDICMYNNFKILINETNKPNLKL